MSNELNIKNSSENQLQEEIANANKREKLLLLSLEKINPESEQLNATIQELRLDNRRLNDRNRELEQSNFEITNELNYARESYLEKAKSDLELLEQSRAEVQDLHKEVLGLKSRPASIPGIPGATPTLMTAEQLSKIPPPPAMPSAAPLFGQKSTESEQTPPVPPQPISLQSEEKSLSQ